ncbi:MAG: ferrochelatase [Pirellulaceae bacterium]|jgi:ferrochelatase
MSENYDAIIVVSFGGPEGPDDVMPFLENVLRGRNVPRERMLEVAKHYQQFGGVSPINQQNLNLIEALEKELADNNIDLPVYFGNRNWQPLLPDTLEKMKADGVKRALALFTSAFSSYSGCRQYRENVIAAREQVGDGAPEIDKLRMFYNHPGFLVPISDDIKAALAKIPTERRGATKLIFTAHSIPLSMASGCNYVDQLTEATRLLAELASHENYSLVYQSRSGPPMQPWLEPDVCDYIREIHEQEKVTDVIVVPIGFISDHMEVLFDLDTEAKDTCEELGIGFTRAMTIGTHPDFITAIRELIEERIGRREEKRALGTHGPCHDVCPVDCCTYERPQRPVAR